MIGPNDTYKRLVTSCLEHGRPISRRGQASKELFLSISTWDMINPVITVKARELNYQFMMAEALWILHGRSDLGSIAPYCNKYGNYSDDGRHMSGAYGPMYAAQQRYVVDKLIQDIFTRQAVMTFWRQSPRDSSDIPCTVSLQFLINDQMELDLIVMMRSSDLYLGLPYDVFTFSMIAYHTLLELRKRGPFVISLGDLYLIATSQHIYDRDLEKCRLFVDSVNNRKYKTIYSPAIDDPVQLEVKLAMLRDNPDNLWAE